MPYVSREDIIAYIEETINIVQGSSGTYNILLYRDLIGNDLNASGASNISVAVLNSNGEKVLMYNNPVIPGMSDTLNIGSVSNGDPGRISFEISEAQSINLQPGELNIAITIIYSDFYPSSKTYNLPVFKIGQILELIDPNTGGGTDITAVGYNALVDNTGANASGFGNSALQNNTGDDSSGFGVEALQFNTGANASGFGNSALQNNTGDNSSGFGFGALQFNTGFNSSGFGYEALLENTGDNASGFGVGALQFNTGVNASGFGNGALIQNIGDYSSGFGNGALALNTGANVSGFGYNALQTNTGANASGFGASALRENTGANASGFGYNALYYNQGANVSGFGKYTLVLNAGENNTAIGFSAGFNEENFLVLNGSNNTFLGANASYGINTTISNSTAVGANVLLTDSNTVILGNGASVGIGTTSPNYKLDVDDTIGVGNSLIVNHVPGTFPRVFPSVTPGEFFETEPTGRVGVVNNQDSGEWAFSAVSVADGTNFTNRSGLLHSNTNAYRLVLANTTEENIRLNSGGNSFLKGKVAIGHDAPTEALDVEGIVKVSDRVKTNQISVNGGGEIKLNQATFYNTGNICNKDYADIGATLHLRTDEPLVAQSVIAITRGGQNASFPSGITQSASGDYTFLLRDSSNTQRVNFSTITSNTAFIDNTKIILCGTNTSTNGAISIDGKKWSSGVRNAVMAFNKTGTQTDNALEFYSNNDLRGSISYSDTGTAYNVASDYRLKENVVEITDGIERLKQLKPSRFNFISNTDKVVDGFIAHEVQEVIPEAVTGLKDATEEYEVTPAEYDDYGNIVSEAVMGTREAYQQIDQAKIVPLLTAALQEAIAKIESLEARIQALESK